MHLGNDHSALPYQRTVRLLAANLPDQVFSLLAQALQGQPEIKLVGHVHGQLPILVAAAVGVDILILGASAVQPLPGICTHLLHEFPHLKIIVSSADSSAAIMYWLNVQQVELPTLSVMSLRKIIRMATQLQVGF